MTASGATESEEPGATFRGGHDPYAALRVPGFRRVLAGSMLATIAAEMQTVALGWEIAGRTRDPLALGLVGLVLVVPVLVLTLPAGHMADFLPRRAIIVAAQVVSALVSLGLAAVSLAGAPVGWIYLLLGVAGTALALALPARASWLPEVVPLSVFPNAVAWRTTGWQVAAVSGPALGGRLLGIGWSPADVYRLSAALGLVIIVILIGVRERPGPRPTRPPLSLHELLAGIRFVARDDRILAAITLDMFAVLLGGASFLLPFFAQDVLKGGPDLFGWLRAAPALGASVMAVVLAHRPPFRRPGRVLLLAVSGYGLATIGFGLSRQPALSFACLAAAGALDNVSVVIRGTLVQLLTPDGLRGRVAAVNAVFIGMSNELGGFESGLTAKWWGPVGSVLVGGVGAIVVASMVGLRWPSLARLGRLTHELVRRPAGESPSG